MYFSYDKIIDNYDNDVSFQDLNFTIKHEHRCEKREQLFT